MHSENNEAGHIVHCKHHTSQNILPVCVIAFPLFLQPTRTSGANINKAHTSPYF